MSPSIVRESYHETMTSVDRGRPYPVYDSYPSTQATLRRPSFPGAYVPVTPERKDYYDGTTMTGTVDQKFERRQKRFGQEVSEYDPRLWTPSFSDKFSAPQATNESRSSPLTFRQPQTTSFRPRLSSARTSPVNVPDIPHAQSGNHIATHPFPSPTYSVPNRIPMQFPSANAGVVYERPHSIPSYATKNPHLAGARNIYDLESGVGNQKDIGQANSVNSSLPTSFEGSIPPDPIVVSRDEINKVRDDGPLNASNGQTVALVVPSTQSPMLQAKSQSSLSAAVDFKDLLKSAPALTEEVNKERVEAQETLTEEVIKIKVEPQEIDHKFQQETELSAMIPSDLQKSDTLHSTEYSPQRNVNTNTEDDTLTRTDVLEQMNDVRKQIDIMDTRLALISRQRKEMLMLWENTKFKPLSTESLTEKLRRNRHNIVRSNRRVAAQSRDNGLSRYHAFCDIVDSCLRENQTKGLCIQKRISSIKKKHFERTDELRQKYTTLHSAWLAECLLLEELAPKLPSASQNKVDLEAQVLARNDFAKSEADLETVIERSKVEHAMDPAVRAKPNAAKLPVMETYSARFIDNNLQVTKDFEEIYGMKRIDDWTADEHELFCELFTKNPKQFGKISEEIDGRDRIDCLYHYYATKRDTGYKEMVRRADRRGKTGRKKKGFLSKGKGLLRELARDKEDAEEEAEEDIYEGRPPKRTAAPTTFSEERQKKVSEDEISNKKQRIHHLKGRTKKDTENVTVTLEKEIVPVLDKEEDAATTLARFGINVVPEESLPPQAHFVNASRPSTTSSYWSAKEIQMFPSLLREFGTAWHLIGSRYGTKSTMMVRNYFQRLSDRHPEYVAIAEKADIDRAAVRHPRPIAIPTSELHGPAMALFTDHGRIRPVLPASEAPPRFPSPKSWQSNPSSVSSSSSSSSSSNATVPRMTLPQGPRTFNISSLLNTEPDTSDTQTQWFEGKSHFPAKRDEHTDTLPRMKMEEMEPLRTRNDDPTNPKPLRNLLSSLLNPLSQSSESNERGA